jgi:hypothetical protein
MSVSTLGAELQEASAWFKEVLLVCAREQVLSSSRKMTVDEYEEIEQVS